MKSFICENKCMIVNNDHEEKKLVLGYFDSTGQIEKILTIADSGEFILNGWINISDDERKNIDQIMFELKPNDAISFYLNRIMGKERNFVIRDGEKKVTFYRDDDYNIYIIFHSNENNYEINKKFRVNTKGNYRLNTLFEDISDNLIAEDHQITMEEYLYERRLKK